MAKDLCLKSDLTFSPRSPISPCWERKQNIKSGKALQEPGSGGESATKGQIVSGVKSWQIMESAVLWLLLPTQTGQYQLIKAAQSHFH